jgi:hypothetical protein
MAEYKFIPSYFEVNYHIHKGTVYRNEDSSGECQIVKEKCLRACFSHFIKLDCSTITNIRTHFSTDGKLRRDTITRCCCSQNEPTGIGYYVLTHKKTQLSFIVGNDCFSKLFNNADDVDTYKKEICKSCGEFVAKTCTSRPNLCNQKCARIYAIKEARFRQIDNKKVYLKCVECDAPKKNENQQKYKLCYNCDQEKKLDAMLRTPDGEIHGYASSGDEDTYLLMGSLSIS